MTVPTFTDPRQKEAKVRQLQREGVIFIDPEHAYIEDDVRVGEGTIIHPNVYLYRGTKIGKNCSVGPSAFIEGTSIAQNCQISFGAHITQSVLNPQCQIEHAQIKRSFLGKRTKAKHHCYIGDAVVYRDCNIGAGTVFCNYDGSKKSKTILAPEVFVGSGTMLVAPLRVGKGSYIAAGSVVTKDVPPRTLVIARSQNHTHELKEAIRAMATTPTEIHKRDYVRRDKHGWRIQRPATPAK